MHRKEVLPDPNPLLSRLFGYPVTTHIVFQGGNDMNRTLKVLMTLTALALVLGLAVGCPSKETPAPTKPAEGKPTEEKPAEELEVGLFHF